MPSYAGFSVRKVKTPSLSPASTRRQPVVLQKCSKSFDRAGVGGEDAQHAARRHVLHRLARLQHGQRAFEPLGVER